MPQNNKNYAHRPSLRDDQPATRGRFGFAKAAYMAPGPGAASTPAGLGTSRLDAAVFFASLKKIAAIFGARLVESSLCLYMASLKKNIQRNVFSRGGKKPWLRYACALSLPVSALFLTAYFWAFAPSWNDTRSLRHQMAVSGKHAWDDAYGSPLFQSQAALLDRLAEGEDSLLFRPKILWRVSGGIMPVSFASNLPTLDYEPDYLTWFGSDAPSPRNSMLVLGKERPLLRTMAGYHALPQATDFALSGPHAPYGSGKLERIATGEQPVEALLADFRNRHNLGESRPVRPRPYETGLNDPEGIFYSEFYSPEPYSRPLAINGGMTPVSELQCRSDRVELAAWLESIQRESLHVGETQMQRAARYRSYVERYSKDYSLPPSLVFAIMRIESSFNPRAVSIANALGLMQVVPHTAGGEVHAYLTGKQGIPGRELLFTPERNIQYGTTYLYLLNSRHFKEVENPVSRELCVIAAYNGGPNAVLRSFDRDRDKAIGKINSLTPEDLYTTLVRSLPSQETRDYVVKVVEARNKFRNSSATF